MLKKSSVFLLLFFLVIAFTGCETKQTTRKKKDTAQEKIELVFYNLFDPKDSFAGQIQAYQSSHPNVKIVYEKYMNPAEYEDLIVNELAEGKGPDIFAIHNTGITKHKGKLAPLPTDGAVPMIAEKFHQTFFDIAFNDLVIDNQIYGMPLSVDTLALYYNKEYIANTVPGTNKPARTWTDLKKQVILLTRRDNSRERFAVTGLAMGRADNITHAADILNLLFLEYETKFYDTKTRKAIFSEKQGILPGTGKSYFPGVLALELYTSFALPSYNHYSWNQEITGLAPEENELNPFARGKVAMVFGYSHLYDQIKVAIENQNKLGQDHINLKDVRIAEIPQVLDPAKTVKLFSYGSYYPLVVSKMSKHPRESWKFIQFITSKESQQTYFEKTHRPTSRLDLHEEQSLDPIYGAFTRQAKYAKSIKVIDKEFHNQVLQDAITAILETKNPKKALKTAQNKINCLIEKKTTKKLRDVDCLTID